MIRMLTILGLLTLSFGQLLIPDSNFIRLIVDAGFATFDIDPKDGFITKHECDLAFMKYDTNGDGCVSEQEFEHENNVPIPHVVAIFYHHFDKKTPDCVNVSILNDDWNQLDTSGDGKSSLEEFEHYVIGIGTSILASIFPIDAITG